MIDRLEGDEWQPVVKFPLGVGRLLEPKRGYFIVEETPPPPVGPVKLFEIDLRTY